MTMVDHGLSVVSVPEFYVVDVLEVAGIRPGADDQTDPALAVLPGTRHQAAGRVVEDRAHLDSQSNLTILDVIPQC